MGDTPYHLRFYNDEYFVTFPHLCNGRIFIPEEYYFDKEFYRFQRLDHFVCDDLSLEEDIYNDFEDSEVNPKALDLFIYRTLLSASLSQEEGAEEYGISDAYDGVIRLPEEIVNSVMDGRPDRIQNKPGVNNPWQENDKKKVKRKSVENYIVEGSASDKNGNPTISMTLKDYRCMMKAELESKVRYIQEYYAYQWSDLKDDRTNMYKQVVLLRDENYKTRQDNVALNVELSILTEKLRNAEMEMDKLKCAKKKKRAQAKQRRAESKRASKSEGHLLKEGKPRDTEKTEEAESVDEEETRQFHV